MYWYRTLVGSALEDRLPGTTIPASPWSENKTLRMYDGCWESILSSPFTEHLSVPLWERSKHRDGYAQWDTIVSMGLPATAVTPVLDPKNRDSVAPKRDPGFNEWWYTYVKGKISRGEPIDDKYHLNVRGTRIGKELLNVAHALTHARMDHRVEKLNEVYLHGAYGFEFMKAVAELFIGYLYGLPVDPLPGKKTALPYGIYAYPDVMTGYEENPPEARMPVPTGATMQVADDVLAVVSVAIDIGPDPVCITGGRENPLQDYWAYKPIGITIAGWETAIWVAAQETRPGKRIGGSPAPRFEYVAPANDLLPPIILDDYVAGAAGYAPVPERFGKDLERIVSDAETHTCFFPCNTCFVPNPYMDDGLRIPYGRRPTTWNDKDFPEWKPYREKVRKAFRAVDKAQRRYYGSNYQRDRSDRAEACKEIRRESIRRLRRKRER